ncbi:hypothetical protein PSMK_01070 [Phycisphaera mikurensis NBRC 102666]|uniref:AI-2E family transporter n=1 Tax=Phycisphaera mikurensis (strain NBRC 102666 / KCTC 22515 / FYK2301M01) TaxID=1142394 RepID=I0IAH8_PHYMF|nr:hypothetical protein PSMK_01070 [Phycisphaera mikurensis NBRC 102666]
MLAGLDPMGEPATPVWRLRWFQVLLGGLVALAVASYVLPPVFELVYMTRPVLLPVLIGLGLAYAVNPLVTWASRRHRMPRVFSAAALLLWFFGLLALAFAWLTGPVIGQAQGLLRDIPAYIEATTEAAGEYLEIPDAAKEVIEGAAHGDLDQAVAAVLPEADAAEAVPGENDAADPGAGSAVEVRVEADADAEAPPATLLDAGPDGGLLVMDGELHRESDGLSEEGSGSSSGVLSRLLDRLRSMELSTISSTGFAVLDVGASTIIGLLGLAGYLTVATLVVCFCFFFAVWKWPAFVAWWMPYLPASHRDEIIAVAVRMDRSVAAFLRGRLIQATLLAIVLSVGFTLAGTPGGLILGIAGGILGLVPYAGAIVWPIAVGLSVMSGIAVEDGPTLWWAVLGPTLVYGFGQGLDAWVIEPLVQGKATNLDALTVLLVVLAGGAVAGLLGLLLAIPFAACVKILWQEVIGPRVRAVARAS